MQVLQREKTTFGQLFSIFLLLIGRCRATQDYELAQKLGQENWPWESVNGNMEKFKKSQIGKKLSSQANGMKAQLMAFKQVGIPRRNPK